jgi:hypothetical protein
MSKTPEQALAAYDALYKNPNTGEYYHGDEESQVAYDLAEALRATLPTFDVVDVTRFNGKRLSNTVATGLASKAEAQNWIAQNDPAARRDFDIREVRH